MLARPCSGPRVCDVPLRAWPLAGCSSLRHAVQLASWVNLRLSSRIGLGLMLLACVRGVGFRVFSETPMGHIAALRVGLVGPWNPQVRGLCVEVARCLSGHAVVRGNALSPCVGVCACGWASTSVTLWSVLEQDAQMLRLISRTLCPLVCRVVSHHVGGTAFHWCASRACRVRSEVPSSGVLCAFH
jgi:hypothetical protein